MRLFASVADRDAVEREMPWAARGVPATLYQFLTGARDRHGARPALSFQLLSDPKSRAETLTWAQLHARVTQAANLLRGLGVGETDTVAYLLPNCPETVITLLGGAVAGVVNPINPLLEPAQIAAILRETGARVLVTLRSFPQTDIAQKVARVLDLAPGVETVLEVDLAPYLAAPKRWIVPLLRPAVDRRPGVRVLDFAAECARQPGDRLQFPDAAGDRIAAAFHTGGTTGLPRIARHRYSGMIYNGWLGAELLFTPEDVLICPLPLFHVFAAYPVLMSCIASGAHLVLPTPAGYRGAGVLDNFWRLIERWQVSFLITVPTAIAALMQRPVDADVSSLKIAISGSAPLPNELYSRFKAATGVEIAEGYGLTEATCLVACNPVLGRKKVGSVGVALPYTQVRMLRADGQGGLAECATDEVGEICIASPAVQQEGVYLDPAANAGLFHDGYLRTGDLGRIDADGYLWITGRARDLIIRGGHNIDPALIEEALLSHPAVAFAGAVGQPDAFAGELPCAAVELVAGGTVTVAELMDHCRARMSERAAVPRHIEILPDLPKTAVGKIFKPALRKRAITRVYDAALAEAGLSARVAEVVEDRRRGLVAQIRATGPLDPEALRHRLDEFTTPWDLLP